jgi:hypothetical protein
VHLLIIPNCGSIRNVSEWRPHASPEGAALLAHMDALSTGIVAHLRATTHAGWRFRRIFHARPSMEPLHLHVHSLDLEASPNLKTKRHFCSFAEPSHYVELDALVAAAAKGQGVVVPVPRPDALVCLWCGATPPNVPALKTHLASCPRRKVTE